MIVRYRYEDYVMYEGVLLELKTVRVTKKTPKGAWIQNNKWERRRFVLDGAGKRYAHETKELAWEAYRFRKESQLRRTNDAVARATYALRRIELLGSAPETSLNIGKPEYWSNYVFD